MSTKKEDNGNSKESKEPEYNENEDESKDQLEEKQVVEAGGLDEEKTTNLVF